MTAIQTVQALVDILDVLPLPEGYVDDACTALAAGRALLAQLQAGETARPTDATAGYLHKCGHMRGSCPACHQCLLDAGAASCPVCEPAAAPAVAQMLTQPEVWSEYVRVHGRRCVASDDHAFAHGIQRAFASKNRLTLPEGENNA